MTVASKPTGSEWVIRTAEKYGWRVNDEREHRRLVNFKRGQIEIEMWTTRRGGISVVTIRRREENGRRTYRDLPPQIDGTNKAARLSNVLSSNTQ